MLIVQCNGCKQVGFAQNHQAPDGALDCECCPGGKGHPVLPDGRPDHAAMANSCSGQHDGSACPDGTNCIVLTPLGEDCPGGHCAKGVEGCTVCRPITITVPPGSGPKLSPAFSIPPGLIEAALREMAQTAPSDFAALVASAGQGA